MANQQPIYPRYWKGGQQFAAYSKSPLAALYRDVARATTLVALPTQTLGTAFVGLAGSSQIAGGVLTAPMTGGNTDTQLPFQYIGGYDMAFGVAGNTVASVRSRLLTGSASATPPYSVRFGFAGDTQWEFKFQYVTGASYRIRIDDQWTTEGETALPAGTAGSIYGMLQTGLDAGPHIYQIDFHGALRFGGIWTAPTATLWKPEPPKVKAVLYTDSTGAGANGPGVGGASGIAVWWNRVCDLLGWSPWNAGIGGTGFTVPGTAVTFADPTRIALDVNSVGADVILISGSRNDSGATFQQTFNAAVSTYQAIIAANPTAFILTNGPWMHQGAGLQAGFITANSATRAAALACGLPFMDLYQGDTVMGDGTVINAGIMAITGTGFLGSPVGDGNADIYIGTDHTHPTLAGHTFWAHRDVRNIKAIIKASGL